jgi:hypothetical protein
MRCNDCVRGSRGISGAPGAPLIAFFAMSGMPRAFPLSQS